MPSVEIFIRQDSPIHNSGEIDHVQSPLNTSQNNPVEEYHKQRTSVKPPQFLVQQLEKQTNEISLTLNQHIKEIQSVREDRTFMSYFYDRQEYIQEFYMKDGIFSSQANFTQKHMKEMLQSKMQQYEQNVVQDIHNAAIMVYKKKDLSKTDLAELERLDQMRLIKIREGELKSKLDILNDKMQQIKYLSENSLRKSYKIPIERMEHIEDQLDYKSFGLDSTKTRLAEEYVIKKQAEIKKRERRKRVLLKREEEEKMRNEQEKLLNEAILKKERRDEILGGLKKKRQKLEEDRRKNKQRQQEFMNFLLQYKNKKPLYKLKEEEFEKRYLIPLEEANEKQLNEMRENHKQISIEELMQHEKSYLERKEELSAKRGQEIRLIIANRYHQKRAHYKSHFHSMIESEGVHANPNGEYHEKEQKRKEYGLKLKKEHAPSVDQNKKKELQELIQKSQRKNKRLKKRVIQLDDQTFDGNIETANVIVYEEIKEGDHKKDGLRYLEFARRIGERMRHRIESAKKRSNSLEKQHSQSKQSSIAPPKSSLYNKPLSEHEVDVKNQRYLNSWADDLKNDRLSEQQRLERVRVKSMLLDGKARNKQQLMRHAHFDTPLHEIKQKAQLDEHYISSIKAKVALLNLGD